MREKIVVCDSNNLFFEKMLEESAILREINFVLTKEYAIM